MTTPLNSATMPPSVALCPIIAQYAPSPAATILWAVVDLTAVVHNGRRLTQVAGVPWMAAVKAGAYGYGLGLVALMALSAEASWLEMAQLAEVLTLRAPPGKAGVSRLMGELTSQAPRLLTWLLPVMESDRTVVKGSPLRVALAADLDLPTSTLSQPKALSAATRAQGGVTRLHLKTDTGMPRGGVAVEELPTLAVALRWAEDEGTIDVVGLQSHLSRVDESASGSTGGHLECYQQVEQVVLVAGLSPPTHHLAATGGLLWHPQTRMNLARTGIGTYGLSPDPFVAAGAEFGPRPVIRLKSPLVQVKHIGTGQAVFYGGTWSTPIDRWMRPVPLGHFSGIPRAASSVDPVGVDSLMTSVVGRVYMNQVVIDLGPAVDEIGAPLPAATRIGGTVALQGVPAVSNQEAIPTADEWVQACGTINYEIVVRLGARAPRCYVGESDTGDYS